MNESERARFRDLILQRLSGLDGEDTLGQEAQSTVMLDQQSVGRLSRMDALQSQAMAQAAQARRNAMRQRLKAALARIDEGEFGFCDECGEEIGIERLRLEPALQLCISCARG